MPILQEILDENEFVLIDGNIIEKKDICTGTYEIKHFASLDIQTINDTEKEFRKTQRVIHHPHATTIPEVAREIRACAEIIGCKLEYLSRMKKIISTKVRNRTPGKRNHNEYPSSSRNEEALKRLQETIFLTYEAFQDNETKIKDPRIKILTEMVRTIDLAIGLKQEVNPLYGLPAKDPTLSDTDEKLVATLYYRCMFSQTSPVLLTRDSDFGRLLRVTPRIMGSDEFLPYNQSFRTRLAENPFKLYVPDSGGNFKKYLEGPAHLQFNEEFFLGGIPQQKNQEIREQIRTLWKQFSGRE